MSTYMVILQDETYFFIRVNACKKTTKPIVINYFKSTQKSYDINTLKKFFKSQKPHLVVELVNFGTNPIINLIVNKKLEVITL